MTADSGEEAVKNGRAVTRYDQGMCQKYVRDPCWRVPSLYGSAIDAWNGSTQKHPGDRTPPIGAPCYYRGGQYGHAVIYVGDGKIRTTDAPGAGQVSDQPLDWPETHWGYDYLGWTGDLNGIDLPLGGGDDMPLTQEEISKIARAVWDYGLAIYDTDDPDDKKPAKVVVSQTHTRAGKAAGYKQES